MQNNIFTKTRWLVTIILLLSLAIPMAWGQASTYTSNVTLSTSGGTNASTCTVIISGNNYDGIKIGTSKKSGEMQFSIPSGTTTVYVHVAAWNGESGSMTVSTSVGSITTGSSLSLTADAGVSSNSPFTLSTPANASTSYFFTITLSEVNSAATITLSYSNRAVIWGINTVAASCSTNPSVGNASLNGTFNMTVLFLPVIPLIEPHKAHNHWMRITSEVYRIPHHLYIHSIYPVILESRIYIVYFSMSKIIRRFGLL